MTAEQSDTPIWAAAKARKKTDIVREVTKSLDELERERAARPVATLTERDLEAEQLRLEEMLHFGTMVVEDFRRLQEIDYFLDSMQLRRQQGPSYEGWRRESMME